MKEKLINLLPNSLSQSNSTTLDSFRSFREKYALFVVREFADENAYGSVGGARGDWIFNYDSTFAELSVKGVVSICNE